MTDYGRLRYTASAHRVRYRRYIQAHGLTCQACGGTGRLGYDSIYDGPADPCGWCETTGLTTRWLRGLWLRMMRDEKRSRRKAHAA